MAEKKLTAKQEEFVRQYLVDLNATQAAIRAGYSEKSADNIGSELLGKTGVAEAIAESQKAKAKDLNVTVSRILEEYAAIAFTKLTDIAEVDDDGKVIKYKPTKDWPESAKAAVQEMSNTASGMKIKLYGKTAALTDLAKHLGMFIERKVIYDATKADEEKDHVRSMVRQPGIREAMRLASQNLKGEVDGDGNGGEPTKH